VDFGSERELTNSFHARIHGVASKASAAVQSAAPRSTNSLIICRSNSVFSDLGRSAHLIVSRN